jgi:hypothetical protein
MESVPYELLLANGNETTTMLGNMSDSHHIFYILLSATSFVGFVLAFLIPLISWRGIISRLSELAETDEFSGDASLNWGLIQSHRTYDMARSTIMDSHYAVRRAIRRFLRITSLIASLSILVCTLAIAAGFLWMPHEDRDDYWPVVVAVPAAFAFAATMTILACVGATFQSADAVASMSLLVGACPSVDLAPLLLLAERVSLRASISTASAHAGVVIASYCAAVGLIILVDQEGTLTPSVMVTIIGAAAAGQHVAAAIFATCAITLHHAVDDAIDLSDRAGRHAMAHGLLAGSLVGNAFSVPAAVGTVVFDSLVAFNVCFTVDSWAKLMLPVSIIASATVIALLVNVLVTRFRPCNDVVESDTVPRRSHTTLWLSTTLSVAAAFGLVWAVSATHLAVFSFCAGGAAVTLFTVETAQFLARGPMVRWVCRASINASTSAALASVDSITLVPALLVATVALGVLPTVAVDTHSQEALAGMALGATFPALALTACHGVGSLLTSLNTVAKMVPFPSEQQTAIEILRPPRDQASTASAVASTTSGILVTSVLLMAASADHPTAGAQWACIAAGALFDSLVSCVASIATVGAQARMAPKEVYGYGSLMSSIVPRSNLGRLAPTDRPPHIVLEVFRNNTWWCALWAPVAAGVSVLGVCIVGYSAGLHYAVSCVGGYGIIAQTSALRSALTAGTMRSLHTSGERGKLGMIDDPNLSANADAIHSRKVLRQAVIGTICASTAIITVIALAPHMKP